MFHVTYYTNTNKHESRFIKMKWNHCTQLIISWYEPRSQIFSNLLNLFHLSASLVRHLCDVSLYLNRVLLHRFNAYRSIRKSPLNLSFPKLRLQNTLKWRVGKKELRIFPRIFASALTSTYWCIESSRQILREHQSIFK